MCRLVINKLVLFNFIDCFLLLRDVKVYFFFSFIFVSYSMEERDSDFEIDL